MLPQAQACMIDSYKRIADSALHCYASEGANVMSESAMERTIWVDEKMEETSSGNEMRAGNTVSEGLAKTAPLVYFTPSLPSCQRLLTAENLISVDTNKHMSNTFKGSGSD
ncbi:hypothetical protein WAI453_007285 [Rhynchosporium graminicola]